MSDTRETDLLGQVPDGLYIRGQWRPATGGRTFAVTDPSTGETVKEIADASVEDGVAALDAASEAFPSWSTTPARHRAEILRRAFDLLTERKDCLLYTSDAADE